MTSDAAGFAGSTGAIRRARRRIDRTCRSGDANATSLRRDVEDPIAVDRDEAPVPIDVRRFEGDNLAEPHARSESQHDPGVQRAEDARACGRQRVLFDFLFGTTDDISPLSIETPPGSDAIELNQSSSVSPEKAAPARNRIPITQASPSGVSRAYGNILALPFKSKDGRFSKSETGRSKRAGRKLRRSHCLSQYSAEQERVAPQD